ncbi:MAG: S1 RNA-binding domain-containing protein, partial [Planctomycetota bacterium]
ALEGAELDALVDASVSQTKVGRLEPESRHVGKILAVHAEDVFVELGLREQGVVPAKMFSEPPQVGDSVEVRVVRFRADEGLYELSLPAAAADVGDWGDLEEGMLVEAKVTGTNSGGLECEVNHIRGFIPVSQIDLYRVEKTDEYVGQSFTCLVVECNPQRKNLVLSRRAVLEREKEQAEKLLWDSLAPGQVREGVVRRLTDFGAFVDIGGVDGLLHVSQMGWGRVKHPSEVVQEGQTIKVRVDKVDRDARRISLSYRDMTQDPWLDVERKYPINSAVRGKVVKIMEFGAFVELEPGVEGLVHISELANKRVWRVSDVVSEGDEVDVAVLSIDKEQRRISLSMKSLLTAKEAPQQEDASEEEPPAPEPAQKVKRKPQGPLKGGLGRSAGSAGERFGLKW